MEKDLIQERTKGKKKKNFKINQRKLTACNIKIFDVTTLKIFLELKYFPFLD